MHKIEKEHDPRRAPTFICLPRQIPPTQAHRAGGVGDAVPRGLGSAQTLGAGRIHFARAGPILRPKKKGTTHVVPFAFGRSVIIDLEKSSHINGLQVTSKGFLSENLLLISNTNCFLTQIL